MADKEISELTAADTLDGDEIVHISQGGNSRKATLLDIVGLSTGAMLTATYDPNADGIIAVAQGGTNAATAAGARTNLGLGTMAVQAASAVAITGGSVAGITDLAIADGGTGASTAAAARANLDLEPGVDVQAYLGAGTDGQVLKWSGASPVWGTVAGTGDMVGSNNLSELTSTSTARTNLGVAIGTNVQAYSATLAGIASNISATPLATQTEAEAGTAADKLPTVQRVKQAIDIRQDVYNIADPQFGGITDFTGGTTQQTTVDAAFAAANTDGRVLRGRGTLLTTASIPNFHDVEKAGNFIIKRGSDNFYIWPKLAQTNNLYVATTGSDTNDGLTSSQPLATVQKACDIVAEYAPRLPGRWVINLAAGTYTENVLFDSRTDSEYPITIKGPVVASPGVPTAIIAAASTSTDVMGFDLGGHFILQYIKLQGATTAAGLSTNGAKVSGTNIHIESCLQGVEAQNQADVVFTGGIWTGRGTGVAGGVGYQGYFNTTHDINGVTITAYERGGVFHEGVQGHLDNSVWNANGTGLNIKRGAGGMNTSSMTVSNNSVGILCENNAWYNNGITFTSNSVNVQTHGSSPELVLLTVTNTARTSRQMVSTNFANHTGTTTETDIWTSTSVPAWVYGNAGHTHKVVIFGTCAATTAAIDLRLKINNGTTTTTLGTLTLPIGSTSYYAEFTASYLSGASWRTGARGEVNGAQVTPTYNAATSGTVIGNATTMRVSADLGAVGDSILFGKLIWESTVGG